MIIKSGFKKISVLVLFILLLSLPFCVDALEGGKKQSGIDNPLTSKTFSELAEKIIVWIRNIGLIIGVIMIIWAGYLFMSSRGDEEKVKTAKKALIWTLIGMAILIIGEGFIGVIKDLLGAK